MSNLTNLAPSFVIWIPGGSMKIHQLNRLSINDAESLSIESSGDLSIPVELISRKAVPRVRLHALPFGQKYSRANESLYSQRELSRWRWALIPRFVTDSVKILQSPSVSAAFRVCMYIDFQRNYRFVDRSPAIPLLPFDHRFVRRRGRKDLKGEKRNSLISLFKPCTVIMPIRRYSCMT